MVSINSMDIAEIRGREKLDVLVSEVDKLVTLPDIYYRLESVLESPVNTLDDISSLLSTDPYLCARLLRMANSAFYSFPARIETIERAIGTIGLRQLREMVLATSVIEVFNGIPTEQVYMRKFWKHSVAVGVMARAVARYAGLPQSERHYIPGLLHDIGRLVLYLKLPGMMGEMLERARSKQHMLHALEQQQLGYNHADIGGRLLAFWKVPQSIYEPVSYHHDPMQAREFVLVTCTVHIANAWVNCQAQGSSGASVSPLINNEAMQLLNLQEDELEEIWARAADEIVDIVNKFLTH
ncbi:MAG: HDOD domain-containing protein [Gammaproteobacteria bacterium]|nr:HDOD domain-containing protein [Gammaproteobacteria bacterium]